jgi:hypothetical protein
MVRSLRSIPFVGRVAHQSGWEIADNHATLKYLRQPLQAGVAEVRFLFDNHPECALYNGALSGPDSVCVHHHPTLTRQPTILFGNKQGARQTPARLRTNVLLTKRLHVWERLVRSLRAAAGLYPGKRSGTHLTQRVIKNPPRTAIERANQLLHTAYYHIIVFDIYICQRVCVCCVICCCWRCLQEILGTPPRHTTESLQRAGEETSQ